MKSLLLNLVGVASQFWPGSSFTQWLFGVVLTLAVGFTLYALGHTKRAGTMPSVAKYHSCLQAAGPDLKQGELLAHDASCTCGAVN